MNMPKNRPDIRALRMPYRSESTSPNSTPVTRMEPMVAIPMAISFFAVSFSLNRSRDITMT